VVARRVRRAYEVRFGTRFEPFSPEAPDLAGVVDVHAHGHAGQQDPLAVARLASAAGMGGILWKTLGDPRVPWVALRELSEALARWAGRERVQPVPCAVGLMTEAPFGGPTLERVREAIDRGATAVWLPVVTSVNSLMVLGAPGFFLGKQGYVPPMTARQAHAFGGLTVLERGHLRPGIVDLIHHVADRDVALFFGHAAPAEALALAEEVARIGFRKAVIDHPRSPVIGLKVAEMRQVAAAGVWLNWTYDELSPLLGVDPQDMVAAIRAVGPERCLLSSDAGDPLLPHGVESMRLLLATMEGYGLPRAAVRQMAVDNPGHIMGLAARGSAGAA
jgi:hypothetical protein